MRRFLLSSLLIAFGLTSNAQIDPSSALLLNSGRTAPVRESGIDSGRYTVRQRAEAPVRQERVSRTKQTNEAAPTSNADSEQANEAAAPSPMETPGVEASSGAPDEAEKSIDPVPGKGPVPTEAITKPAVKIPLRQLTMIDLSIAPGYIYNDSNSSFTYRNYSLSAPILSIDANVWLAPSFGLHTGFVGTSNAHVSDSLDNQRGVSVTEQWFLVGLRFRKFFGYSETSPVLTFGLDYQEYQFRVPSESLLRGKLSSTGIVASLETEIPSSAVTSWTLGAAYAPKLNHKETSNATDFSSGTSPGSSSVSVFFGSRYRFDQKHSVFWKISQSVEKNLFEGDTSVADPVSGQTQHGVGVTNTTTMFQLGYTWAD